MQNEITSPARRDFLKVTAAAATLAASSAKRVLGANERIRIAVIGVRGRGWDHVKGTNPYRASISPISAMLMRTFSTSAWPTPKQLGIPKPQTYIDVRKLLEDKNVDAVSIATPNHWHSLIGIWAAQAGKDIYIEKPCSHNWWEGRQLVRRSRNTKSSASTAANAAQAQRFVDAMNQMQSGLLGNVYFGARALLQVARYHRPRAARAGAAGGSLRSLDRPRAVEAVYEKSVSLQLALDLGYRQRRFRQPGHP